MRRVLAAGGRATGGGTVDETAPASVGAQVDDLYAQAIEARQFGLHDARADDIADLSKIDLDALRQKFGVCRSRISICYATVMLLSKYTS